MNGFSLILQKQNLSQGFKKKITGTNRAPTHLHVGGQEGHGVEQSTDPNGLQQLPLREGS